MEVKKIVVCGDSFCAADSGNNRFHFSQRLQDQYGHNVIILAQGGMSNVGICFQLQEAVKLKPDIIIYNTTGPDRVELVLKDTFNIDDGLRNFVYAFPSNASYGSPYVGNESSPIFSTVWQGLEDQTRVPLSKEQLASLKPYLMHLFDWKLKQETDSWMFSHWRQQILLANIKAIEITQTNNFGQPLYEFARNNPNYNTNYHTDAATQQIVADLLQAEING